MEFVLNQSVAPLTFLLVLASDHITGATGKTPAVTLSKNGGAFAPPIGAVAEVGSGVYKVAPNAADFDTAGSLWLHATAAACDPADDRHEVDAAAAVYGEAGPITHTVTIYKPGGTVPDSGVAVYVSSDIAGVHRSPAHVSDELGRVVFQLVAGPVYVWPSKLGVLFDTAPYLETVA